MRHSESVRLRPQSDQTRSTGVADSVDQVDANPFGIRRVLAVVIKDLYGTKDVQDAITASYVWMADQIGHLTLGLVPTLVLCWIVSGVGIENETQHVALYAAVAAVIFAVWYRKEQVDKNDSRSRAGGIFAYDSGDIEWNVTTALIYFGIGDLLGFCAFVIWWLPLIALAVALYPALAVAFWWLQRKVAFQQADLPYLYRLANFSQPLATELVKLVEELSNLSDRRVALWDVLTCQKTERKGDPKIRHIILTGAVRAGKTSLCVGIGTEFSFALNRCRYLSAAKLVEHMLDPPEKQGDREYADGRLLWALEYCDLVLVDDVDAGVTGGVGELTRHLVDPNHMTQMLMTNGAPSPLRWLGGKRSVWVIGGRDQVEAWRTAIAQFMGIEIDQIGIVWLGGKISEHKMMPGAQGDLVL